MATMTIEERMERAEREAKVQERMTTTLCSVVEVVVALVEPLIDPELPVQGDLTRKMRANMKALQEFRRPPEVGKPTSGRPIEPPPVQPVPFKTIYDEVKQLARLMEDREFGCTTYHEALAAQGKKVRDLLLSVLPLKE